MVVHTYTVIGFMLSWEAYLRRRAAVHSILLVHDMPSAVIEQEACVLHAAENTWCCPRCVMRIAAVVLSVTDL